MNKRLQKKDSKPESKINMNQTTKQIQGGFKMKPTRFLTVVLVLLGLVATASAITEEGTVIQNQAFGNYEDANGNSMPQVESLVVSTTVSQVAGVSLGNNLANPISTMDSTLYAVTLTNTGNGEDTYAIGATGAVTGTGTFSFYVYHDGGTLGVLDGTDADSEISTSDLVSFEGSYNLIIKVVDETVDGALAGVAHVVTLTSTSGFDGDSTATITLTSTVQAATVTGAITIVGDNTPAPGEPIVYQSCFNNDGTEIAYNPVFVTTMPSNTTLDLTSVTINGGSAVTIETDGTPPYYYNTTTRVLTLELSNLGITDGVDDQVCIVFTAIVDDNLAAGAPIDFPEGSPKLTYENEGGAEYPGTTPIPDNTFPSGGVDVAQTFAVSLDNGGVNAPYTYTGDPGDTLIFDFTVTNDGNGTDNFTFDDTTDYVTWVFYEDTDEDGVLSAGEKAAGPITETGDLAAAGVGYYIAIGTIPVGTADTATDTSIIAAISQAGAAADPAIVATGTDTNSTTCTAPILTLVKSVSPTGNQPPGTELTYTIVVANSGTGVAKTVVVSDAIPLNTTYVAESMTVDTAADDDDNVVDGSETVDNAFKAASSVLFDFDTIPAVNAGDTDQHTLTFKVTID